MESKPNRKVRELAKSSAISRKRRWVDPGQELRYSAHTQDDAYQTGAYDVIGSRAFAPRIAVQAGYVIFHGAKSVLDIGCGTGELLKYLNRDIRYVGLDIAPTAIATAKQSFHDFPKAEFHATDFWEWQSPDKEYDCIVWAGIGRTWTRGGRKGDKRDWLDILATLSSHLGEDGVFIIEAVTQHWPKLSTLISEDYTILAGCDLDCLVDDHRAVRSTRVIQPKMRRQL